MRRSRVSFSELQLPGPTKMSRAQAPACWQFFLWLIFVGSFLRPHRIQLIKPLPEPRIRARSITDFAQSKYSHIRP
jgi:hypothetical protein